jgi:phospholipase D1/2
MIGLMPLKVFFLLHFISASCLYNTYNVGFIKQMEYNSGVMFHEAQVALSRQWVAGDSLTTQKEILIVIPQEENLLPAGKPHGIVTEKVPIPVDDEAARRVVERFEAGATNLRSDDDVSDTVAQHMLADKTSLFDEAWLGTEQEELNA